MATSFFGGAFFTGEFFNTSVPVVGGGGAPPSGSGGGRTFGAPFKQSMAGGSKALIIDAKKLALRDDEELALAVVQFVLSEDDHGYRH